MAEITIYIYKELFISIKLQKPDKQQPCGSAVAVVSVNLEISVFVEGAAPLQWIN